MGAARYDTVILGGGVAALWTARVLQGSGQAVLVLTNAPLGSGQSLAAQGVIHGGLKYAVGGKLTEASEALAKMPERWLAALNGAGPVDLSGAELLSDHQILWTREGVVSQVVGFFGSKAVRGRSAGLKRDEYPAAFASDRFRGRLFRIDEPVVDPVSVIRELSSGLHIHQVDWDQNARIESEGSAIAAIHLIDRKGASVRIEAGQFVLAAGAGNGALLDQLGIESPRMQRRPLHQVIVRKAGLPPLYGVCVGTGPKPPLVVTTHRDAAGRTVWYGGGEIAEQAGVARSEAEQIEVARKLFAELLPWVDLGGAEWFTWRGDRAEPLTGTGDRPAGAYCRRIGNVLVAWPTKLALAPDLADQVLRETAGYIIGTGGELDLPRPGLGTAPWDLP